MINWYVDITEWAPETFRSDKYIKTVIDTATPFMNHFCKRLSEIDDWKLEDANRVLKDLIDELPIMSLHLLEDEFSIKYNTYTYIRLTDTVKQIYRESKLNKILYDRI